MAAGSIMPGTAGRPTATTTTQATATTTSAFAFFSSLSCQKYTVHGWYASAWIMTRPLSSAGISRTKRYMPAASGRISKAAVGYCSFTIDQERSIKGRLKGLKEINEKVISDY